MEDLLQQSRDTLFLKFQEDGPSEYYVWFMRLLTAGTQYLSMIFVFSIHVTLCHITSNNFLLLTMYLNVSLINFSILHNIIFLFIFTLILADI